MNESKLQQLTKHLINVEYQGRKLALPEQFSAWIEGGRIETASKRINGNGLIAARFYYSGVISINPCAAPVELMAVYISLWLQEHGGNHDSNEAEFSADINDDNSSEIEFTIKTFSEDIELVECVTGAFLLNDKRYDFGENCLWIAESFTLNTEVNTE